MVEADLYEKEGKTIPVILPPGEETEDTSLDEAGESEGRETLEDQEQSEPSQVDPPKGIDPDKPDLPCPSEDRLVPEEEIDEFEEIPIEEWRKEHPDAPELEPDEVPGDLPVEFEEIPIEEQDESKPRRLSDIIDRPHNVVDKEE